MDGCTETQQVTQPVVADMFYNCVMRAWWVYTHKILKYCSIPFPQHISFYTFTPIWVDQPQNFGCHMTGTNSLISSPAWRLISAVCHLPPYLLKSRDNHQPIQPQSLFLLQLGPHECSNMHIALVITKHWIVFHTEYFLCLGKCLSLLSPYS